MVATILRAKRCSCPICVFFWSITYPFSTHSCFICRVPLLQALIQLFELPEDDSVPDDEHFIEIEDTPGYQTAYSQLAFAGKHESDPFQGAVPNAKVFLAQSLHKLSTAHPGQVSDVCLFLVCLSGYQMLQLNYISIWALLSSKKTWNAKACLGVNDKSCTPLCWKTQMFSASFQCATTLTDGERGRKQT